MMNKVPQERLSKAISITAHAAQILDETLDYVKERKEFGHSIGSFQHNKNSSAATSGCDACRQVTQTPGMPDPAAGA